MRKRIDIPCCWWFVCGVVGSVISTMAGDRITGSPFATRSEVLASSGMAATSQPLATQVAVDILKAGGNAVDAAIAANACLALMEPTGCGLGGDLFVMGWDAESEKLYGLNGSGRSPLGLTMKKLRELVDGDEIPAHGPLPVSVPGCVDGWFTLHERYGELPMAQVLAPAIRYAKDGFPVTEMIARYWKGGGAAVRDQPGFAEVFLPDGKPPGKGDLFKNTGLANTLQQLAENGREVFYRGELTKVMVEFLRENGGFFTEEDFAKHTSTWVTPVSSNYRGYDLWELPPNGQGIAALQILNILEGYNVGEWGFGSAEHVHYFVEAKKLAFEDRAKYYADPDFYKTPVEWLVSKSYAAERRLLISDEKAALRFPHGRVAEEGDTIYLCTADSDRNMVSLIQSNYRGFGSGVCPPGLGFSFQDRGQLFTLREGEANTYAPGKRPFHTIIPAMITRDGKPWMAFGVMGGATQPQGHAQIVMNLVDFKMNVQEAGDVPRVVHLGSSSPTGTTMEDGGSVCLESEFPPDLPAAMEERGHRLSEAAGVFGGYQAIQYDSERGVYVGASESRKDGCAIGY